LASPNAIIPLAVVLASLQRLRLGKAVIQYLSYHDDSANPVARST
jgi:hypothetical protein